MIPSARFGEVRIGGIFNGYVICNAYCLHSNGIEAIATNEEFCLYLLVALYDKLSMHDRPVMAWDGMVSREQAKSLFNNLDETSHLFYLECLKLLKDTAPVNTDELSALSGESKFKQFAKKVITDVNTSEPEPEEGTFREYSVLEFKISNLRLVDHIVEEMIVEC